MKDDTIKTIPTSGRFSLVSLFAGQKPGFSIGLGYLFPEKDERAENQKRRNGKWNSRSRGLSLCIYIQSTVSTEYHG
jgi:hypothetical protein